MFKALVLLVTTLASGNPVAGGQEFTDAAHALHRSGEDADRRNETTEERIARARARLGNRVRTSRVRRVAHTDEACPNLNPTGLKTDAHGPNTVLTGSKTSDTDTFANRPFCKTYGS